ncbi:MAG TPA: PH domain-containing protein [Candidatus Ruania gallistercoris]|uniref:PH domain-containing protein n=1 Tax=Candidatus Ruania gallistercoris TaxID=2838746 RepID=A0A9D2J4J0_9MICO|nr:PH domain-containing protein [Candidatus Ruania gallistercoris]
MSTPHPPPEEFPRPDQYPPAGPPQPASTGAPPPAPTDTPPPAPTDAPPPEPTGAPADTPARDEDGVQWHRVHRVTPFLNAWKVAAALFAIFVWQYSDTLGQLELPVVQILLIVLGAIVLGSLIGLGISTLAWSRTKYGLSDESVFLHSGILFRQQRHVRLDRMQTVDVTQPLLARIAGFSALKIESAGGAGSNLTLQFLREETAKQLRNDLLARAAGLRVGRSPAGRAEAGAAPAASAPAAAGTSESAFAPEAPERPVLTLTAARLLGSLALSMSIVFLLLFFIGLVVMVIVTGNVSLLVGVGAPVLGGAAYWWGRFAGEFSFRVATSPDGIRVRQGLLETKARTIPPGRVQAVQLSQAPMWRIKGWWRISVNIAGYGPEETTSTVLYPVATEAEAAQLLYLVQPDLGTEAPLDVLRAGLVGTSDHVGFVTTPRRARWLDPLIWRRNGYRLTDTVTLLRTGRWWRNLVLVPHERVQSLGMEQGPLARKLSLADIALHSTPGPITPRVAHLDLAAAQGLLVELTERARLARHSAGPERWMESPAEPGAGPPESAAGAPDGGAGVDPSTVRAGFGGILPARSTPPGSAAPPT